MYMKIKTFHICGAIFTVIVGSLLHFAYEFSGSNVVIGHISAVNESTWEHLKLLALPYLFFGCISYFVYGKEYANFIPVSIYTLLVGFVSVILLFYGYTGVLGFNVDWLNILIFVLSVLISYYCSYNWLRLGRFCDPAQKSASLMLLFLLLVCFWIFTDAPPHLGLFRDPVTGRYGI